MWDRSICCLQFIVILLKNPQFENKTTSSDFFIAFVIDFFIRFREDKSPENSK